MDNDLISRSALLKDREYCDCPSCEDGGDCGFCYIPIEAVENAPAVDAVPVVRCKDCVTHGNCLTEDTFNIARIENPFCCGGKRRADDGG